MVFLIFDKKSPKIWLFSKIIKKKQEKSEKTQTEPARYSCCVWMANSVVAFEAQDQTPLGVVYQSSKNARSRIISSEALAADGK